VALYKIRNLIDIGGISLKKLLFTALAIIMTLSLSNPSAFAHVQSEDDKNMQSVQEKVDAANEEIAELIAEAVEEGEDLYEEYLEDIEENDDNEDSLEDYISERDFIIAELQAETEEISVQTKEYAASKGIEVEIYYVDVTIGDITVKVDPLRVIGKLDR
jgi:bifunctional N-acetylglucosamine-1-phosphate-uridyltransferase/glucosamine-1-phosphate-acetyltransferase GlmU-like protein